MRGCHAFLSLRDGLDQPAANRASGNGAPPRIFRHHDQVAVRVLNKDFASPAFMAAHLAPNGPVSFGEG